MNVSEQRFGYAALLDELSEQGVSARQVEAHAGIKLDNISPSFEERLALFRTDQILSTKQETGLLAGQRQEIGFWGHYGYAMATSATFKDVLNIAAKFPALSGSLLRITVSVEGDEGVFRSHQPEF